MKIFLNGALWHSGAGLTRTLSAVTQLRLGASLSGTTGVVGWMDDVRIYDHELSASEVRALTAYRPVPGILLTSPANNSVFTPPATLALAATVVNNGTTSNKVQFLNGTNLLAEDTAPPYNFSWSNVTAGAYSIVARAFYNSTNRVDSPAAAVAVGTPPLAVNDAFQAYTGHATTADLVANDQDADTNSLTLLSVSAPAHGAIALSGPRTISYTSVADYLGEDQFTYVVRNGSGLTAVGTATVSVVNVPAWVWSGAYNSNWDLATTNWNYLSAPATYLAGKPVLFDDSAAQGTVNVAALMLVPESVTVSNSTLTYTIGGNAIDGTGGLLKLGPGTLALKGANTYGGTTIISAGTLNVGSGGTTGSLGTGAVVNNSALIFDLAGTATTASLPAAGITGTGTLAVSADTLLFNGDVSTAGNQTYTATTAGANNHGIKVLGSPGTSLTASNGAAISLRGDLGYLNTAAGGALFLDTSSGNGPINLYISIGRNNSLYPVNSVTANAGSGPVNVTGTSNSGGWNSTAVTLTGAINISGNLTYNAGTLTLNATAPGGVSGILAGTMSLVKNGSDTLTLSGANAYSGATTVSAGKLVVSSAQSGTGAITVNDGATLAVTVSGASQLSPVTLTQGSASGPSTNIFIGVSSTSLAPVKAGTLTLNGTTTINLVGGAFLAGQTYPLIACTNLTGPGACALGTLPYGVTGTLTNTGASIALYVTSVVTPPPLAWEGNLNGTWDIGATANWKTNGVATSYLEGAPVQFHDTASGTTSVTNTVPVSPASILASNATKAYLIGGSPITCSGSLVKAGSGTLTLAGLHNFAAGIQINAGTVAIGGAGQLGGGLYPVAITNNGLFNYSSSAPQTLSGVMSGAGRLAVSGSNTLTLTAANTYSGGTTLSAGTLRVGNGGSAGALGAGNILNHGTLVYDFNNSSAITLPSGAGISGTGHLSATARNINLNGNITLGGSQSFTENGGGGLYQGIEVLANTDLDRFGDYNVRRCRPA